jgi:hypothetical protein
MFAHVECLNGQHNSVTGNMMPVSYGLSVLINEASSWHDGQMMHLFVFTCFIQMLLSELQYYLIFFHKGCIAYISVVYLTRNVFFRIS